MSRLARKNRTYEDINLVGSGSVHDAFDNAIKEIYRITDDEYDYIAEKMTEEESQIFVTMEPTYAQKRKLIEIFNKYINEKTFPML
jgi:hypothetical protein